MSSSNSESSTVPTATPNSVPASINLSANAPTSTSEIEKSDSASTISTVDVNSQKSSLNAADTPTTSKKRPADNNIFTAEDCRQDAVRVYKRCREERMLKYDRVGMTLPQDLIKERDDLRMQEELWLRTICRLTPAPAPLPPPPMPELDTVSATLLRMLEKSEDDCSNAMSSFQESQRVITSALVSLGKVQQTSWESFQREHERRREMIQEMLLRRTRQQDKEINRAYGFGYS